MFPTAVTMSEAHDWNGWSVNSTHKHKISDWRPDDVISAVKTGARTVGQHPARIDVTLKVYRVACRRIVLVLACWTYNKQTIGSHQQ